jgi:4-phytase/acid phosphatase
MLQHLVLLAAVCSSGTLTVEKVILLSRHGIRTPYGAKESGQKTMAAFTTNPDASWGDNTTSGGANLTLWGADLDQGLTKHGAAVLKRMGEYYSSEFAALGGSKSKLTVYADHESSNRDVHTAEAFMSGLLPSNTVTINNPPNLTKWLFNQGAGSTPSCKLPSQIIVDGTLGGNISKYTAAEKSQIMAVNNALKCCQPAVCLGEADGDCSLMGVPMSWNPAAFWSLYSGPLAVGSSLAEWIQLMYLNNLDYTGLVGPAYDEEAISGLTKVHQTNLDITDDNSWTARSFGSDLLAHIVATAEQLFSESDGDHGAPADSGLLSKATDKMVYYAGHDLNIYFIRALLGLKWVTKSFNPNQSPPGGMLRFELLRDEAHNRFIKIYFESQSYTQQRKASPLGGDDLPDRSFIAIPRCASGPEGSCPFETFKAVAGEALDPKCVQTTLSTTTIQ